MSPMGHDRIRAFGGTRRGWALLGVFVCGLGLPPAGAGQSADDTLAVDALRCWRRVGRNAVHVGERFSMTVTCSLAETERARALLDQTALEPAAIDVGPFEVLEGERFEDVRSGPYRFLQYRYTLRVITESSFGEDLEMPALDLTYRIERRVGDDPALQGRELTYVLPPEPVRVLSLVPRATVDIRDLPPATFGAAQDRVFRASALTLLAALLGLCSLGVVALGAARLARERRGGARRVERRLSSPLVIRHALRELAGVQRTIIDEGWTPASAGCALSALRVAASVALRGDVAQQQVDAAMPARSGQVRVRHGLLRPKTALVSSGLTAAALSDRLDAPGGGAIAGRPALDALRRTIETFTTARYSRDGRLPDGELSRALEDGISLLNDLRWRSAAPVRHAARLGTALTHWRRQWAR